MKKILITILCMVFLAFAGSAMGLPIKYTINEGDTNVGYLDVIIASTTITTQVGPEEEKWIKDQLGEDYFIKYDVVDTDWTKVDNYDDIYAIKLLYAPEYFFVKLGQGGVVGPTHFLYENLESLMYAVIDINLWGLTGVTVDIGRVSHIGEIGATPVPEPGMVILLGIGLLGLAFYNRKRLLN